MGGWVSGGRNGHNKRRGAEIAKNPLDAGGLREASRRHHYLRLSRTGPGGSERFGWPRIAGRWQVPTANSALCSQSPRFSTLQLRNHGRWNGRSRIKCQSLGATRCLNKAAPNPVGPTGPRHRVRKGCGEAPEVVGGKASARRGKSWTAKGWRPHAEPQRLLAW